MTLKCFKTPSGSDWVCPEQIPSCWLPPSLLLPLRKEIIKSWVGCLEVEAMRGWGINTADPSLHGGLPFGSPSFYSRSPTCFCSAHFTPVSACRVFVFIIFRFPLIVSVMLLCFPKDMDQMMTGEIESYWVGRSGTQSLTGLAGEMCLFWHW